MKRIILLASMLFFSGTLLFAQSDSALNNVYFNSAEKLLMTKGNLKIGGYGGVHYNQPLSSETRENGKLDVHRFIMMMGYQFNDRTQFVTELEFEHVKVFFGFTNCAGEGINFFNFFRTFVFVVAVVVKFVVGNY